MEVCCNQKKNDNRQRNGKRQNFGNTRNFGNRSRNANRVQLIDQDEEDEESDDTVVVKIEGDTESKKPSFSERFINGQRFETMID